MLYETLDALDRCALARRLASEDTDQARQTLLLLAQDPDALVRTEAYDSLGSFPCAEVAQLLKDAIGQEPDELARFYAILSWSDVAQGQDEALEFLDTLSGKSAYDRVGIACARLTFGDETGLDGLLGLLNHEDYHIRCCVLKSLEEFLDEENQDRILPAVQQLAAHEDTPCVQDLVEYILNV